ncbi:hypothetical protein ACLB1Q_22810 [Escherichia coli]
MAIGAESKAAENATAVGTKAEANGLNSIALSLAVLQMPITRLLWAIKAWQ